LQIESICSQSGVLTKLDDEPIKSGRGKLSPSFPEFRLNALFEGLEAVPLFQRDLKQEFDIKQNIAYFNNASYTPMSRSTREAISQAFEEYSKKGPSDENYLKLKAGGELAREKLASVINAPKYGIVFTESATQSINIVANGFKLAPHDCIVMRGGSSEHPSNFLPWKYFAEKKQTRIINLKTDDSGLPSLSELDSVLKQTKVKLVVMSHVLYNLGTIMPVIEASRIAHEREALFFLDASQSIGAIPVDLEKIDCDFAAGTAAKWLCGPLGLGFFYCKKEALNNIDPLNFGPNACTYSPDGGFKELDSTLKLQEGFRNWAYCFGLSAALDLLMSFGLDHVRKKNLKLADLLIEELAKSGKLQVIGDLDESVRTSIIALETTTIMKPLEIVQRLSKSNIVAAEREIGDKKILRISPHFYNDEEEVVRLISEIRKISS
jgi:cysteine desulfurase/selenocysteine lyase